MIHDIKLTTYVFFSYFSYTMPNKAVDSTAPTTLTDVKILSMYCSNTRSSYRIAVWSNMQAPCWKRLGFRR